VTVTERRRAITGRQRARRHDDRMSSRATPPATAALETAAPLIPARPTLSSLREAADGCTACDLFRTGTQTVFGAGPREARALFIGEQPGNDEDLQGAPFVGPAGRELDRALEAAGIDRSLVYVTNAVKHFKWVGRGKKRIHQKPNAREVRACRPWLDAEISVVGPEVVVLLGATAAQALLGPKFRVTEQRGQPLNGPQGGLFVATVHPSSILRSPDDETRHRERARFVDDLRVVARMLSR
jgi:DNA polymerase